MQSCRPDLRISHTELAMCEQQQNLINNDLYQFSSIYTRITILLIKTILCTIKSKTEYQ